MAKKKEETVGTLIDFMTESIGESDDIFKLSKIEDQDIPGIAVPSPQFEYVLESTNGKIPYGSIIEIIGWESVGKTTFAWQVLGAELMRCAQSVGHYNDIERSGFGYHLAKAFSVDGNRCWITQPQSGEKALDATEKFLVRMKKFNTQKDVQKIKEKDRPHGVCINDSVAALKPGVLLEAVESGSEKKTQKAALAALMSERCPIYASLVPDAGAILIFINQWRNAFNFQGRSWNEPCGGKALRFYADLRFSIFKKSIAKVGGKEVGIECDIQCIKNKLGIPYRTAKVIFGFGNGPYDLGMDIFNDLFIIAKQKKILNQPKGQAWCTLKDSRSSKELKFQGLTGLKKEILKDKELLTSLLIDCNLKNHERMYIDRYKVMVSKQEDIEAIKEEDIVHELPPPEAPEVKTAQMSDGEFDEEDEKMQKDAAAIRKKLDIGNA